jgi:hypothetical protein
MDAQNLLEQLVAFDKAVALELPGQRFRVIIVGGCALVLLGYLDRATYDIDALSFPPALTRLMSSFDINGRVASYSDQFAYNLEDRMVRLDIPTKAVEFFVASLEDLVASKLYSDRDIDQADIRRPEILSVLDWAKLAEVIDDMKGSMLIERRYNDMLSNYREYREEYQGA